MSDGEIANDESSAGLKLTTVSVLWILAAMAIMLVTLWTVYWAPGRFWAEMS